MKTIKQEQDYIVQRGFLSRIKEAMESGFYPDMERGEKLVKEIEALMKQYEESQDGRG